MYQYHCLNQISDVGIQEFSEEYVPVSRVEDADAVLVRSASMHEMEFGGRLKAIARAGAGVNNIPLERCAEEGIVVFNTPGANANGVKELVIAGMLLASRDIIGGINWVQENEEDGNIAKDTEKAKKAFAGCELDGKKLGVIGLGAIGVLVANAAVSLGMDVYGYDPYVSVDSAWNLNRSIHHAKTVEELIAVQEDYQNQLNAITSFDDRIAELNRKKEELYSKVLEQAKVLTSLRTASAKHIEEQMKSLLIPLGMPNVRFAVKLEQRKEPDSKGMDTVTFLFSANKNGTLQNVASIASGGEIARVMLSLKAMIAGAVKLPTIIFDEIDTGVSGSIAEKMALIMQDMGKQNRQVISITHLPQIAARGNAHYKVYKKDTETGTNSYIRQLTDEERVQEIAHMLSGTTLTDAAVQNARALLEFENK